MSRKTKAAKAFDRIAHYSELAGDEMTPEMRRACVCDTCVVWAALNSKPKKRAKRSAPEEAGRCLGKNLAGKRCTLPKHDHHEECMFRA